MERSYRFRLYPNRSQAELINKTFGCCRYVYNYYLSQRINSYRTSKTIQSYNSCAHDLLSLKRQNAWLKEVNAQSLQASLRDLDYAYQRFIHSGFGFPHFKTKHNHHKSFKVPQGIVLFDGAIKLPKLGCIKCRISKPIEGRILSATVSQVPSGNYYVSICCTDIEQKPFPKTGASCGIDLGIKDLAVTSDGVKYQNHKYIYAAEKKLARLQRQLSRKSKDSKRYEKTRIKVARLHEHISNQRRDTIQKLTTEIVRQYDVVCIENLSTSGMLRNHHLAKSISDVSFSELRRELEYKATWYGKTISVVDKFYPSSQLCSMCGSKHPITKNLSVREWVCPFCGCVHDRDINAARNILIEGLRILM